MKGNFLYRTRTGEIKVPVDELLFLNNLNYFEGMGRYSNEICYEKALLVTGYRVVSPLEHEVEQYQI